MLVACSTEITSQTCMTSKVGCSTGDRKSTCMASKVACAVKQPAAWLSLHCHSCVPGPCDCKLNNDMRPAAWHFANQTCMPREGGLQGEVDCFGMHDVTATVVG